ncbi:MAG TPA: ABC transporter permease [Solirubrobacteraceae bacterium]|nr:ABC transporter permease [Solirubrobacteraceae bacterium]
MAETVPLPGGLLGAPPPGGPGMPEGGEVQVIASGWKLALREFLDNRLAVVGVLVLVFFVLFCFVGPLVYHTNQVLTNPLITDLPPGGAHPLGTDENGFDELGRIMLGGQSALEVGFLAAFIAIAFGTVYGAVSGLAGGIVDNIMMRFVDVLLSIPFLLIVLVLATKYSATVLEEALVLSSFSWLVPARLVRGEVLTLRERDFVYAARVMGSKRSRLVLRHLIPNALSVVIVNATFQIADAILALAYLGFLGFGLQYPAVSWGDMLGNAQNYVSEGYWWLVYPVGACLVLVVLSCNLIGDALRDAFDVRLRRR